MNKQTNKPTAAELGLEHAQGAVNVWLANVGTLETRLADARGAVARFDAERKEHFLAGSLGDAVAAETARKARDGYLAAAADISDLETALVQARGKLSEVRAVADRAAQERAKEVSSSIIARRIAVADRIDSACAELESSFREFNDLVGELSIIPGFDGLGTGLTAVSRAQTVAGERRVAAALPGFIDGLVDEIRLRGGPGLKLGVSERTTWSGHA
jgi:hypothetical protein